MCFSPHLEFERKAQKQVGNLYLMSFTKEFYVLIQAISNRECHAGVECVAVTSLVEGYKSKHS